MTLVSSKAPAAGRSSPPVTAGSTYAVRTFGLTKRFAAGQVAVDQLELAVPKGSVYGFLGPNGSGKTTTIRMLLGLIAPTAGHHELLGQRFTDGIAVLPRVGALIEGPAFHPYLNGAANLARLDAADTTANPATAADRIATALGRVGLAAAKKKKYRNYSLGMRQRLGIAGALLRDRELLILDEPTNGLDPQGTREVRSLIAELAAEGVTILLSTHLLAEVEQICTHVGVMREGRLVAQDSLTRLRARVAPRVRVQAASGTQAAAVLQQLGLEDIVTTHGECSALLGELPPEKVVRALVAANVAVREFSVPQPNLEEIFVQLTGDGFDVSG